MRKPLHVPSVLAVNANQHRRTPQQKNTWKKSNAKYQFTAPFFQHSEEQNCQQGSHYTRFFKYHTPFFFSQCPHFSVTTVTPLSPSP